MIIQKTLKIRNWDKWQSYRRDRDQPPWIKVHRRVMRNPDWIALSDAQRGHVVALWLLAADKDGVIPADPAVLKKVCHLDSEPDLKLLISAGFLEPPPDWRQDDANLASERRRSDAPEEKRGEEKRGEENRGEENRGEEIYRPVAKKRTVRPQPSAADPEFEAWWQAYPRREAKGAAEKSYMAARKIASAEELLAGATKARQKYTDPKFTPMPATWLNQKRWQDENGASGSSTRYTTGSSYV